MPLIVAPVVSCPSWRTVVWAAALVATLVVGCNKADVDLSGFNLNCAADTDCPDGRTCGVDGICVARVGGDEAGGDEAGGDEAGSGEGGEGEGEGEGGSGGQGADVGTSPGQPGEGEGEGGGADPPGESFDCMARCGGMASACPEDSESAAEQKAACVLICEFIVRQVDPEVAGCVFRRFDVGQCDGDEALKACAQTCQSDSDCAEAGEGRRCTFLGGDEVGVCAQPTDCGEALRCTLECPDDDGHCVVDCLGNLHDFNDLRSGVVALACEADCGGNSEHPVCDRGRHQDGECEWAAAVCVFGGANDDFACRDIVSCMLNTCNDSHQDCRDLCGGGPVAGQDWPASHPDGWPELDECMDQNCSDGGMSAEECFRDECGGFVEEKDAGCGYPIHDWPPEPEGASECWGVYECFVRCFEGGGPSDDREQCKEDCGDPQSDDGRRRAGTLFGCMADRCPNQRDDEGCAERNCGPLVEACRDDEDPPLPICMEIYGCIRECRDDDAGGCDEGETACFTDRPDDEGNAAAELNQCMEMVCAEDYWDAGCATQAGHCPRQWSRCHRGGGGEGGRPGLGEPCEWGRGCRPEDPALDCVVELDDLDHPHCATKCLAQADCPNDMRCVDGRDEDGEQARWCLRQGDDGR